MDDVVRAMLTALDAGFPPVETMTGAEARAVVASRRAPVTNVDDVAGTVDHAVPGRGGDIPIRVYRPHDAELRSPAIVFFHGGGFVFCDIDTHDGFCRAMAKHTRTTVLSVGYRLAPENPAPAAAHDAIDTFAWAVDHADELALDPARVLVAGDSAGGNLAAVVALAFRDETRPAPAAQVLIYPMIDPSCDSPSQHARATGCVTTRAALQWYWRQYLGPDDPGPDDRATVGAAPTPSWLTSPVQASRFDALPPAVVITAGLDPLRSEGTDYARRLRASGVHVVHRDFPGLFHGFLSMMSFGPARAARDLLWSDVRDTLATSAEAPA